MAMVDIWSLILLVVILMGFSFLFGVGKFTQFAIEREINSNLEVDVNSKLVTLLRANVGDISMTEFIVGNIDDYEKIADEINPLMNKICDAKENCDYTVEILKEGQVHVIRGSLLVESSNVRKNTAEFQFPSKDKNSVIRLILYSPRDGG